MAKLQQNSRETQRWLIKRKKKATSGLGRKWKEMSSGQGGLLRALSVAHSSESGAEAPCGCARFGEGPVEKCLGGPRVGLQAAQEAQVAAGVVATGGASSVAGIWSGAGGGVGAGSGILMRRRGVAAAGGGAGSTGRVAGIWTAAGGSSGICCGRVSSRICMGRR